MPFRSGKSLLSQASAFVLAFLFLLAGAVTSQAAAGGNISISAVGDGTPEQGDLTVKGSDLKAANILLSATRDLKLQSQALTQTSENKTTSTNLEAGLFAGGSVGNGGGKGGIGIYGEASINKTASKLDTNTYEESRITTSDTLIATDEGWLYLAGIKDLFNGELVGYALSERMTTNLVSHALFRAVTAKRPPKGLIHHSDRGSQYCSHAYRKQLQQFGMLASMSRKGDCWDNAPMESFWGSLKNELVHHRRFATREQAKREITEYIEIFYNRIRKQARLGYLSPAAFSQQYHAKQIAA